MASEKPKKRLSPYQRIMRAAERGTGLRLSWEGVFELSMDDAIASVAWQEDEKEPKEQSHE